MQRVKSKWHALVASIVVIGASAGSALADRGGDHPHRGARRAAMLEKYDANKDGALDDAERAVMKKERMAARFAELDTNRDGVLSVDEFSNQKFGKFGKHGKHGKFGKHARPEAADPEQ